MRRVLLASLFAAASISLGFVGTAGAAINPTLSLNPVLSGVPVYSNVILAFDFSDNSSPPSASSGTFNVIADVFPENTGGYIRMVAVSPAGSGVGNMVCKRPTGASSRFSRVRRSAPSISLLPACGQFTRSTKSKRSSAVSSESITNLRVGN